MAATLMGFGRLTETGTVNLKRVAFVLASLPAVRLAVGMIQDSLGADPVDTLTRQTGIWSLNFLMMTLAVGPLKRYLGWAWPLKLRRMLGLYSFFYATLHLAVYVVFEQFFDVAEMITDIVKRPYITAGLLTYMLLLPLAMTSTNGMIRWLGIYWKPLHRLVYLAAIGGTLHYLWLVKRDITDPGLYIILLCALLISRLASKRKKARASQANPTETR
jgi:sulfoxide reductase heme-binding subunit YedZ